MDVIINFTQATFFFSLGWCLGWIMKGYLDAMEGYLDTKIKQFICKHENI